MSNDKTIIITTVTESVKLSELNHRDRIIYNEGYEEGEMNTLTLKVVCTIGWVAFLGMFLYILLSR